MNTIDVVNASEHNLKNVSLQIPRDKLVVFTGVSGSGKSSLAFDTIYAEAQRSYIDSLSRYASQYLTPIEKPQVESISGLSPAISIDQKSVSRSPRSTVGTTTEIMDYLRVLFARIGTPHCPECQQEITPQSLEQILQRLTALPDKTKLVLLSPVVRGRKGDYNALFAQLLKEGFTRAEVDGEMLILDELSSTHRLERHKIHDINVVIDRIVWKTDDTETRIRLSQAISRAMKKSDGFVIVDKIINTATERAYYSKHLSCPNHDLGADEMAPRLFSFNSHYGACKDCQGLGYRFAIDTAQLVPNEELSLEDGAVAPLSKILGRASNGYIKQVCKQFKIPFRKAFSKLTEAEKNRLFNGLDNNKHLELAVAEEVMSDSEDSIESFWSSMAEHFDGVLALLERRYLYGTQAQKSYIEQFMTQADCSSCEGKRLNPLSLSVTLDNKSIADICELSVDEATPFFNALTGKLPDYQLMIARQAILEIQQRLLFLNEVGLGYLALSRRMSTLSGGESQRIRLASQIGSGLSGVLYVLDEPSIGLHPQNNQKLIQTLKHLRDLGNSVLVVEHDESTIREADWLVDIGPNAGRLGGEILSSGPVKDVERNKLSPTAQFLTGQRQLVPPKETRYTEAKKSKSEITKISITGATRHNLKNISVELPLGNLIVVTGMSGSGKSTLVFDLLEPILRQYFGKYQANVSGYKNITGLEHIDKLIEIDQAPIGRTPRSNPATYTGLFDNIRKLFSSSLDAKLHGYGPGHFSFNVANGRCAACKGDGNIKLAMTFLPDVYTLCESCNGKRYKDEVLDVKVQGKSIADVLAMTVEEALGFFENYPSIANTLAVLNDTGLGYIHLGQPATTLSGGEAQRLKLATELCKRSTGKTLYLLDEPTIGLHWHDLEKLLGILNRLVDAGNTVVVIEHDTDFIKMCDYVIDLGPEGGPGGGEIIACGSPKQIAQCNESYTGQFLQKYF